jgi:Na(+)-translocating NADH:ubiquinone oxidoreductase B subunit
MKLIKNILHSVRPLFEDRGRLRAMRPVFEAADNFFFSHPGRTSCAPYGRDPIDVKRYMTMVIVALMPAFLASLYFFGPRVLLLLLVSYVAGGLVEVLFAIVRKEEINEGFLVTGFLFPLILPPGIPLWMVAIGSIFGVLVGKEVFGGTGRNLFNAALVGRCFLAFAYPARMTAAWVAPGPEKWLQLPGSLAAAAPDAVTLATPLGLAKGGVMTAPLDLFIGNVGGCVGETSTLAILIGAVILLLTGIANWRIMAGGMLSLTLLAWGLNLLWPTQVAPPGFQLLAGGWMFGVVFMATDPVTGPATLSAKWAYGILIGTLTVLIRSYSGFVEGTMFAILFGNICAPLMDEVVIRLRIRRHAAERACS